MMGHMDADAISEPERAGVTKAQAQGVGHGCRHDRAADVVSVMRCNVLAWVGQQPGLRDAVPACSLSSLPCSRRWSGTFHALEKSRPAVAFLGGRRCPTRVSLLRSDARWVAESVRLARRQEPDTEAGMHFRAAACVRCAKSGIACSNV